MDEPGMKASFKLTLVRHKSFPSAFFNTPLISSVPVPGDEWSIDSFEPTVEMSTYLVAFVLSDFKSISMLSPKGIRIEVVAKPQSIDAGEGDYSLNEAAQIIDFFDNYFDVPYPLEKLSNCLVK
jgi:aminopeptidase N